MAVEPDTNGTPLTDVSSEIASAPSTPLTDAQKRTMIEDMMQRRLGGSVKAWSDRRYKLWLAWTSFKHHLGIHTYIPTEYWDPANGVIYFHGEACWICDERR